MNIIITLPPHLIEKIIKGEKQIEIRKTIPKQFNIDKDVVFVVTKGTNKVSFFFTIRRFYSTNDVEIYWHFNKQYLGIHIDFMQRYWQVDSILHFWEIAYVQPLLYPIDLIEDLHCQRAPQSFVYCDVDHSQFLTSRGHWCSRINSEERCVLFSGKKAVR